MREFARSIHCRSHAHCVACRDLDAGRSWRRAMAERFDVPARDVDFDCPDGLSWSANDMPNDKRASEKKPCGCGKARVPRRYHPPTRPSCPECVEKHLGAAWVLIAEHQNGYPHRLLAIGHLHEAEDESQEWPDLHAAIRAARKAFQADGTMPDWDKLATCAHDQRTALATGGGAAGENG